MDTVSLEQLQHNDHSTLPYQVVQAAHCTTPGSCHRSVCSLQESFSWWRSETSKDAWFLSSLHSITRWAVFRLLCLSSDNNGHPLHYHTRCMCCLSHPLPYHCLSHAYSTWNAYVAIPNGMQIIQAQTGSVRPAPGSGREALPLKSTQQTPPLLLSSLLFPRYSLSITSSWNVDLVWVGDSPSHEVLRLRGEATFPSLNILLSSWAGVTPFFSTPLTTPSY